MQDLTRRAALKTSLAAAGAVAAAPWRLSARGLDQTLAIGVIGCGIRGKAHVEHFGKHPECAIRYVCDPDQARAEELADLVLAARGVRPLAITDLRRVLDDTAVDCVSVATCNHWHALASVWAMQAGKDVYVEKPLSWAIAEGRRVIQAARKYGRICQVGTQHRSNPSVRAAKRFIDEGGIGAIRMARNITYKRRRSIGPVVAGRAPESCDYQLWSGPAPRKPITRRQFHYDWHWFWDYGNGDLGNSDIHRQDLCCWALGRAQPANATICFGGRFGYVDAGETPNTQIAIHDLEGITVVSEMRGLPTEAFPLPGNVVIYGTEGMVVLEADRSCLFDLEGRRLRKFEAEVVEGVDSTGIHVANFIEAVRSRDRSRQHAEAAQGHVSAAMCHLANNCYRLGSPVSVAELRHRLAERQVAENVAELLDRTLAHLEANGVDTKDSPIVAGRWLEFDPDKEIYGNSIEANHLLQRTERGKFTLPDAVNL